MFGKFVPLGDFLARHERVERNLDGAETLVVRRVPVDVLGEVGYTHRHMRDFGVNLVTVAIRRKQSEKG